MRATHLRLAAYARVVPTFDHRSILDELAHERDRFVGFVRGRVGTQALAEDIVQATFARAIEHLGELREPDAARAWFFRSLRNAILDQHRRRGAAQRRVAALARESEATMVVELADRACGCIEGAIERLGPSHRQAIRKVHGEGLALDAYARETGITRNNAAVRVYRARKALHEAVKACCGGCAESGCRDCTCPGDTPNPRSCHARADRGMPSAS